MPSEKVTNKQEWEHPTEDPPKVDTRDVGIAMTQEVINQAEQVENLELDKLVTRFHDVEFENEIRTIIVEHGNKITIAEAIEYYVNLHGEKNMDCHVEKV